MRPLSVHVQLASILAFAALAIGSAAQAADAIIATREGAVRGREDAGLSTFKGLRYAAAPVGERRWQPPQPLAPWVGTRDAQDFGLACMQKPGLSIESGAGDPGAMGEDCLTLNVWTPDASPATKLPVMVWIHGGALVFGSGRVPGYDGAALARRGAVVVTLNYRLAALGFFAHPAIAGKPGSPVNFGLLDQIAALQWVQRNIAAFGGDPDRVTIFGQSAGAQSVLALFASPLAKGLFQQGIAQSPYGIPSHTRTKARATAGGIATALGLKGEAATAAELRALPAEAIVALNDKGQTLAPSFIVGDAAVPVPILTAFQRGIEHPLPLVIGSTSDDGSVAVAFGVDPSQLVQRIGASRIALRALYPKDIDDTRLGRETMRDVLFTTFARRIAYLHSARAPTWRYFFSYAPPDPGRQTAFGVPHGGEIAFTMDTVDLCQCVGSPVTDTDRAVSAHASRRWFDFARSGTPVPQDATAWPPDTRRAPVVLQMDATPQVQRYFMRARLDAFTAALKLVGAVADTR